MEGKVRFIKDNISRSEKLVGNQVIEKKTLDAISVSNQRLLGAERWVVDYKGLGMEISLGVKV